MKYDIIYADPPWQYNNKITRGAAESHYPTMSLDELKALPVKDLASDNCVLFLWATYPCIEYALELIKAWGFKYKTLGFQWVKVYRKQTDKFFIGLGNWTRGNTEPCLLAVKGSPKRFSGGVRQLVIAPVQRHSQKPNEVRIRIKELMGFDKKCIELFAREKRNGWDSWGNEVESDIKLGE